MDDKINLLRQFYDEVYRDRRLDRIPAYFTDDAELFGLMPGLTFSPADLHDMIAAQIDRMAQVEVEVTLGTTQGDWLSARISLSCTEAETGKHAALRGLILARYTADGAIAEAHNTFDFLSFFEQLGQVPRNALPLLLTGAAFR